MWLYHGVMNYTFHHVNGDKIVDTFLVEQCDSSMSQLLFVHVKWEWFTTAEKQRDPSWKELLFQVQVKVSTSLSNEGEEDIYSCLQNFLCMWYIQETPIPLNLGEPSWPIKCTFINSWETRHISRCVRVWMSGLYGNLIYIYGLHV